MEEEVNTDLLYKVQKELRGFRIYDDQDIASFCEVYFAKGVQTADAQGVLVSKLVPAVQRYQEKAKDDQYQIRRVMRNFCKWYKYVSQVVRMFDKELHREFVYCSFLVGLLPTEVVVMDNIAKLLTLEMYKLEKTSTETSVLATKAVFTHRQNLKAQVKPEDKDPLDEIIARINEKYKGDALLQKKFTVDFLTKKQKVNEGEVPQYYVTNSHPAIIEPELFDLVQYELKTRKTGWALYELPASIFRAHYLRRVWRHLWQQGLALQHGKPEPCMAV